MLSGPLLETKRQKAKFRQIRVRAGGWHGVTLGVTLPAPRAHPNLAKFRFLLNGKKTKRQKKARNGPPSFQTSSATNDLSTV